MLPLSEVLSIKWNPERGQKLKEIRGDITLTEVSKRMAGHGFKVSRQYLNKLEIDPTVHGVAPDFLSALAQSLGVKLSDLLCLSSKRIVQLGVDKSEQN